MNASRYLLHTLLLLPALALQPLLAQEPEAAPTKPLLDVTATDLAKAGITTDTPDQVKFERSTDPAAPGVVLSIQPGKAGYPGIVLSPPGGSWDLSQFGHVVAKVTNEGTTKISTALRLDNSGGGPQPWNTEVNYLSPGETKDVKVIFGHSYGKKDYALDPARVVKLLVFGSKNKEPQTIRIHSITAGGKPGEKPPVKPDDIYTAPKNGVVLGAGVALDAKQLKTMGGTQAAVEGETVKITFKPNKAYQAAVLKPVIGRWDFREALQAKVKLKNTGTNEVTPSVQLEGVEGKTDKITADAPLAPGAEIELTVPFASSSIWNSADKKSGSKYNSQKTTGIAFSLPNATEEHQITVISVTIGLPPAPELPEWLGKRPPVEGPWKQTLAEEFTEPVINDKVWSIYGSNYWDKVTHFSKNNVILKDGTVTLRVTKERGPHNDDPNGKVTDYATGFMQTYGKFVQRYGYFEARVKLTRSPGVWPAFWLMPNRGEAVGPQWKRQDTKNGGMEFDIMEHLSGWGIYRYNIAMHWDGYDKDHKAIGTSVIYVHPDKDGFITTGLLWTPGSAVFYANGQEVGRHDDERVSNVQSEIMFTLPMGGWDNLRMDDAQLPADFVIDYVRVWQREDLK